MITIPKLAALALGEFLTEETKGRFGTSHARLAEFLPYAARLTLECIGNSDALYHDLEHSLHTTWIGQNCSCSSASTVWKSSTLRESPGQSNIRVFPTRHPRTTTS